MNIDEIIKEIKELSVIQLNELVKSLEKEFGVSASARTMAVAQNNVDTVAQTEEIKKEEQQTEFKVILKELGANKIELIKVIKQITGLGIIEAKALAVVGGVIKENVSKEEANKIADTFKNIGASVELK